ncbi:chorion class B protein Ld34-like [Bombyx mandarina]|uniref:Chorion class B protein Ld34-like n=1 Tax=Bombyx mandarina TaxID=7092 RepID=A0A6J2JGG6_BOMMA|nr:chorion class B protein Ld34-like [Bombyx mandarina]
MYLCFVLVSLAVQGIFCQRHATFSPGYEGKFAKERLSPNYSGFGIGIGGPASVITPGSGLAAAKGGGLTVTSASPIAPTGLSILSEGLSIDGGAAAGGNTPFSGNAVLLSDFSNAGSAAVNHKRSNGAFSASEGLISKSLGYKPGLRNIGIKGQ